jgi:hypothetical protein
MKLKIVVLLTLSANLSSQPKQKKSKVKIKNLSYTHKEYLATYKEYALRGGASFANQSKYGHSLTSFSLGHQIHSTCALNKQTNKKHEARYLESLASFMMHTIEGVKAYHENDPETQNYLLKKMCLNSPKLGPILIKLNKQLALVTASHNRNNEGCPILNSYVANKWSKIGLDKQFASKDYTAVRLVKELSNKLVPTETVKTWASHVQSELTKTQPWSTATDQLEHC